MQVVPFLSRFCRDRGRLWLCSFDVNEETTLTNNNLRFTRCPKKVDVARV